jgi:heat shock protein HslJ
MLFGQHVKDQPELKIQVELNTTRVAAHNGLFNTELKHNRLLRMCMTVHNDAPQLIIISEWGSIITEI